MKRWAHSSLMGGVGVGLNFLREKDCEKIHEASLEVLHDRGAYFDSETAREVLRDHGCWEDADGCTHFPRTLVESALEAVPAEFVHRGRTPDDDIHMAQDQVYASNFGEGIFTHDLETGERRSTVKQDAVDILRVVDSLDNIHIYNRAIGPQDVPSESASMHNAEVAFCYTSKPMHLVSGSPCQTKKMIKMAEIAAGGKEELKRRPRTAFNHTTISPLRISHEACENAMIVDDALERIDSVLQMEPLPEPVQPGSPKDGSVELERVSFSYDGVHEVLRGLDLAIPAGATVALVGPSGGGKTTTCSLLPRFYDPERGSVEIDGIDIRAVTVESLRDAIGIVQQDVYLFGGTIRDNIAYGRPDATTAEIVEAAKRANIDAFVRGLPDGYDTYVGERGARLSGGQKQRIAIARTLLRDNDILILDDSLSAVDTETDQFIREALKARREAGGRAPTTFIISHRITTLADADWILVVEDGRIAQQGTHADLIAEDGLYRRVYRIQAALEDELNRETA